MNRKINDISGSLSLCMENLPKAPPKPGLQDLFED